MPNGAFLWQEPDQRRSIAEKRAAPNPTARSAGAPGCPRSILHAAIVRHEFPDDDAVSAELLPDLVHLVGGRLLLLRAVLDLARAGYRRPRSRRSAGAEERF